MIEYTILRKKIKNIYLCVNDGKVIVKAPLNVSKSKIDAILSKKMNWIEKKLSEAKHEDKIDILNGKYIYILGKKLNIEYKFLYIRSIKVELDENKCIVYLPLSYMIKGNSSYVEKKIDIALKRLAEKYVSIAIDKYQKLTNLIPEKVEVRKLKSIWGNCSSKKVIKINQKLIHYKMEQIEYVCLHELTHLKYMNHQKEFWNFVRKYMPNYKEISSVLKR